jgi:HD-GYP domain-containing protein (c-di-GMP phosphodiesterase class II)
MGLNSLNGLYENLFSEMLNAFAHCRAIYNADDVMIDWVYIRVNNSFKRQTGLSDVSGKLASIVLPTLFETNPELFRRFELVAKGGEHQRWEEFVKPLSAWYDISVYSVEIHTFTCVFENITVRRRATEELILANEQIMTAFVMSLESRDRDTSDHANRVTGHAVRFANYLKLDENTIKNIYRGSLLHDIGKLGVPDKILHKTGRLDALEYAGMKQHPLHAKRMLAHIKYLQGAIDIPYCHHEKWDGGGYPQGLKGKDIPYIARLFSIVDVYDAMTSDRPYRGALSKKFTLTYIESQAGKVFDPDLTAKFLKMMGEENE